MRIDQPLYQRNARPDLEAALADTPVVAITGPRQCGKSTLALQVAADISARCVTFDDAGPRAAASADPTGFIEQSELPLFIDEFQKAPAVLEAIKSRVDRERRTRPGAAGMFLLTGSANVWATLRISESLVGRAERLRLWPLSQGEVLGRRERFLDRLFDARVPALAGVATGRSPISEQVVTGGYPELLARADPRRRTRWTQSYLEMILERDVRDLTPRAQQLDELPRLLELSAARIASLLDLTGLSRAAQMKRDTVGRYLRLLELLFLVQRVPAWSRNIGQRLIKAPKLMLPDTGLAAQLTGYGASRFEDLDDSFAGALFENFVATEVAKQASWAERNVRLHHFRTAGGREVDLVIEDREGSVVGLETKLGATPHESDFRGLMHLRERLGDRFRAGVVLNTGSQTLPFGDRLWAAPVSALWSE
ncbi:MAG: ATP-binding protein [Solirubrobacterales bacterium]